MIIPFASYRILDTALNIGKLTEPYLTLVDTISSNHFINVYARRSCGRNFLVFENIFVNLGNQAWCMENNEYNKHTLNSIDMQEDFNDKWIGIEYLTNIENQVFDLVYERIKQDDGIIYVLDPKEEAEDDDMDIDIDEDLLDEPIAKSIKKPYDAKFLKGKPQSFKFTKRTK